MGGDRTSAATTRPDSQRRVRLSPLAIHGRHGIDRRERVHAFAEKAIREASEETSWADPNEEFERAVHVAVDAAYDRPEVRRVIEPFSQRILSHGWSNSLLQKLVHLTMPGVPDVYEGSETFEGSLVDPDNRRPVDFRLQFSMLDTLEKAESGPSTFDSPSAKLWVTRQALHARRDRPELFTGYQPLVLEGPQYDHLLAFDRGGAITLATRLPVGLQRLGGWGATKLSLPKGEYRDVLTGSRYDGAVSLTRLFHQYPVALLLLEVPDDRRPTV